jgi:hypothetical protein
MTVGTAVLEDNLHVHGVALQRLLVLHADFAVSKDCVDLRAAVCAVRRVELRTLRQEQDCRPSVGPVAR